MTGSAPLQARVLGRVMRREHMGSLVVLDVEVPEWPRAVPGQFAMLQQESSGCFLPRAFSLHRQRGDLLSFLISPIGPGTRELADSRPGDGVWVLGPVGRGFDLATMSAGTTAGGSLEATKARLLVVAGGVGAAPFVHLLEELVFVDAVSGESEDAGYGFAEVVVLLGFRDEVQAEAADLFEEPIARLREAGLEARVEVISEDGHLGRSGLVTALLVEEIRPGDSVAACGAHAMCEAVWDLCRQTGGVRAWFSLEAPMACGVGSCQGCVIPAPEGELLKVCRRGPVFAGAEVFRRESAPASGRPGA